MLLLHLTPDNMALLLDSKCFGEQHVPQHMFISRMHRVTCFAAGAGKGTADKPGAGCME